MRTSLLLTLGHNSSAILVKGDRLVCGYEEERLSGVKSDSRFPLNAIFACLANTRSLNIDDIYVTHWDPMGDLGGMKTKYWDPSRLPPHERLITSGADLTHHDCHAHAAIWYAGGDWLEFLQKPTMLVVCDGFGNFGEHLSIYTVSSSGVPTLKYRKRGYDSSLGLMYQYMTAFLGMKMHEDEYKLLGYEAHIGEVDVDRDQLEVEIMDEAALYLEAIIRTKKLISPRDPVVSLEALPGVQKDLIERWEKVCQNLQIEDPTTYEARVILSFFTQSVLESVLLTTIGLHDFTNLIVTGGVFYNVKLNRKLLSQVRGQLCIFPLAGDQGNAIGLYRAKGNKLEWPGHFFWGKRRRSGHSNLPKNFHFVTDEVKLEQHISEELKRNGLMNLVRGAMEFGPRALCNTSTLALPQVSVVEQINFMNGRNTIMPMAPVMGHLEYLTRFDLTHKLWQSERHMVCALPYKSDQCRDIPGAAHRYPKLGEATGRPQVTSDLIMQRILYDIPGHVLINTSFNVHGKPIVFTLSDAIASHEYQRERNPNVTTFYQEEEQ